MYSRPASRSVEMSAPRAAVTAASNYNNGYMRLKAGLSSRKQQTYQFRKPLDLLWLFLELRKVFGNLRKAFAKHLINFELPAIFMTRK
jgi:hypothetical protein